MSPTGQRRSITGLPAGGGSDGRRPVASDPVDDAYEPTVTATGQISQLSDEPRRRRARRVAFGFQPPKKGKKR